jgi:hypothetical protein
VYDQVVFLRDEVKEIRGVIADRLSGCLGLQCKMRYETCYFRVLIRCAVACLSIHFLLGAFWVPFQG